MSAPRPPPARHERVAVEGLGNRARATVTVRRGHAGGARAHRAPGRERRGHPAVPPARRAPRPRHGRQVRRRQPAARPALAGRRRGHLRDRLPAALPGRPRQARDGALVAPGRQQRRRRSRQPSRQPSTRPPPPNRRPGKGTPREQPRQQHPERHAPTRRARPRGRPHLPRRGLRRRGPDRGRGGLLHGHDRLPGDPDRPELPPAGRRHDGAARRQHRGQRRGRRVRPDLGGRLRRARPRPAPVQLALPARRSRTSSSSRASSASAASTPGP